MDEDEERRDDLTPDEAEQADDDGIDAEEEHRAGEFDYLRDLMQDVLAEVRGMREDMAQARKVAASVAVENGARVTDAPDGGADVEAPDELPDLSDPRDRDYMIER